MLFSVENECAGMLNTNTIVRFVTISSMFGGRRCAKAELREKEGKFLILVTKQIKSHMVRRKSRKMKTLFFTFSYSVIYFIYSLSRIC